MYKWYVTILFFVSYVDYKEINYWYIMDIFLKELWNVWSYFNLVEYVFFFMV